MFTNYTDDNIDDDEIVDIKIHKKGWQVNSFMIL
jgi:hypothetical protein